MRRKIEIIRSIDPYTFSPQIGIKIGGEGSIEITKEGVKQLPNNWSDFKILWDEIADVIKEELLNKISE